MDRLVDRTQKLSCGDSRYTFRSFLGFLLVDLEVHYLDFISHRSVGMDGDARILVTLARLSDRWNIYLVSIITICQRSIEKIKRGNFFI